MFDTALDSNTFNAFANGSLDANAALATDSYGLGATAPQTELALSSDTIMHVEGTLRAENFTLAAGAEVSVFSGNGNVDFGYGYYDLLDLSGISVNAVSDYSFADNTNGGVIFNPGNGERVFDYLTFYDGREILFEGMDGIVFSDQVVDLTITPDDPGFNDQWNLHMMGVHNAWRFTTGTDDVLIGVQDTGLGVDSFGQLHGDLRADETWGLSGNLADDFVNENGNQFEHRSGSHGTAVQGIIAADTNNGLGIAGINWNSDVYNIDVLDGNAGDLTLADAAQSMINLASSQGQRLVVNMSLGSASFNQNFHPDFEQVVADNPDVLFAIAAGNNGHLGQAGLASPAVLAQEYDNVMAVGASWGTSNALGSATNPGQRIDYQGVWGSQYGAGLTLMGPSEVITTDAFPSLGFDYNYQFDGTSAATPNVTGVASLVWSANSDLSAAEVKEILSQTSYDLGVQGYDGFYGHGFVNADAAVRQAIALARTATASGLAGSEDSLLDSSAASVSSQLLTVEQGENEPLFAEVDFDNESFELLFAGSLVPSADQVLAKDTNDEGFVSLRQPLSPSVDQLTGMNNSSLHADLVNELVTEEYFQTV